MKSKVYEYVSDVAKALSSPKRLEILDLLCQGEKTVETIAERAEINVKLVSAHLKDLKLAHLVECRREGKYIVYRVANTEVSRFWSSLRGFAEKCSSDLQVTLRKQAETCGYASELDPHSIFEKAKKGEIVLLDVRPEDEFEAGHLPHAVSMPLSSLRKRKPDLNISRKKDVIAYCRGACCHEASEAVQILRKHGFRATRLKDGVVEWSAAGLPIMQEVQENV